jgi:hypothetical protein
LLPTILENSSKKKENISSKDKNCDIALDPINFADLAVCNAAGALHHLTFIDEAKLQVSNIATLTRNTTHKNKKI